MVRGLRERDRGSAERAGGARMGAGRSHESARGAKPGTPFVQEYAIDLQDQQLDTDVACDFVAAEMGVYVKTVLEENHQLFSVRRDKRIQDLAYISCAVSLQPGGQEDADAEL